MQAFFSFFATRRFLPLFGTQFLGAFNDNLLKTAIVVLISFHGLSLWGAAPELLVNMAAGIFILPFFLFSATAGKLAEAHDKAAIARWVKRAEIAIMAIASTGFFLQSAALLMLALFLMGTHSAFFGPLKYSVLPQYLHKDELVSGNGLIEMGTFLAILFGQIGGSLLSGQAPALICLALLLTALAGLGFSHGMPPAPPASKPLALSFNLFGDSAALCREAWAMHDVRSAILGISWFWFTGAIYTTQLPSFTRLHLGGDEAVYTLLLALFSVGIGAGSMVCARLSHHRLELGMILAGIGGMTLIGTDLALSQWALHSGPLLGLAAFLQTPSHWHALFAVTLLGFFGGFFTVPLYTWLQLSSPESFRSRAVAANNIINGFYMVAAAGLTALVIALSHSVAVMFLLTALGNIPAILHLIRRNPEIWQQRTRWLNG